MLVKGSIFRTRVEHCCDRILRVREKGLTKQVAAGTMTTSPHSRRRNTSEAKHTSKLAVGLLLSAAPDDCRE